MHGPETIPQPFALALDEGWSRSMAEEMLDLLKIHDHPTLKVKKDDGYGHRGIRLEWRSIAIARTAHEHGSTGFSPHHSVAFATTVLETMLLRSEDENLMRLGAADDMLSTTGLIWAAHREVFESRRVNACARSLHGLPKFGVVETSSNGWSASMIEHDDKAALPFCLKVNLQGARLYIGERDLMIWNAGPCDPLTRLRLEERLIENSYSIARIEGFS